MDNIFRHFGLLEVSFFVPEDDPALCFFMLELLSFRLRLVDLIFKMTCLPHFILDLTDMKSCRIKTLGTETISQLFNSHFLSIDLVCQHL